jgi:hypothetical protein
MPSHGPMAKIRTSQESAPARSRCFTDRSSLPIPDHSRLLDIVEFSSAWISQHPVCVPASDLQRRFISAVRRIVRYGNRYFHTFAIAKTRKGHGRPSLSFLAIWSLHGKLCSQSGS